MEKNYSDRTYFYDGGARVEMTDVSDDDDLLGGNQNGSVLNWMLRSSCYNLCCDPENQGYNKYDFEGHCMAYRIIARKVDGELRPTYDVKAVYVISI